MVAIKDMKMPKYCNDCDFVTDSFGYCNRAEEHIPNYEFFSETNERPDFCPLVEIQERKVGKCMDCEEYNQEKHYCPKFCDVIRDTTKEMQEFYKGEHEKLEKIEQIVKKELSPLSIDEMSNAEIQIREVLEQE